MPDLKIHVHKIINHFFGESVTVAGLLTGTDIIDQLKDIDLGDELLFPVSMLRADGAVFLDDITPKQLSEQLGNIPVYPCPNDGAEFVRCVLGLTDR